MNDIHTKGQYFTTDSTLQYTVLDFIKNKPKRILEPSIGQGDLVKYITDNCNITFDMYELDESIKLLEGIDREKVIYCDFIKANITKKYKTIIGNPPYVKKSSGNLYLEFIEKCFNLLKIKGELIFIVPSDFLKLTSASKLLNTMLKQGTFTHIYHPNNENLFVNASIDIIVFRYYKWTKQEKKTLYNDQKKYLININGTVTFSDTEINDISIISDYFNVYVGMVTGKESVYKNDEFGNITLLNGKDKIDTYIMIDTFPSDNQSLNKYMLENKDILINRKIKKYTEKNWWLWGAPRNQKNIENNLGKDCIYISNLTRNKEVAFPSKVQYFGGSLLMLLPKKDIELKNVVEYLNSDIFKENYTFSGRFKIGHRQLCNSSCIF
jgi:adenine-specific DNA-methyltransferase